jgi:hypothetical protein
MERINFRVTVEIAAREAVEYHFTVVLNVTYSDAGATALTHLTPNDL